MAAAPRGNPPTHITLPDLSPLILQAKSNLKDIDGLFARSPASLLDPSFVNEQLQSELGDLTIGVTPALYWGGDPSKTPRYYYHCLYLGAIIGRAFAALAPVTDGEVYLDISRGSPFHVEMTRLPTELRLQIAKQHDLVVAQRGRIWETLMVPIFIKALFSGRDPEPGARFLAAMFMLTAGRAIFLLRDQIVSKGRQWKWYEDTLEDPDAIWTVRDLYDAVLATETTMPRENWNWVELEKFYRVTGAERPEYVSKECVVAMDAAAEHLRSGEADWSSERLDEVYEASWRQLWERMSDLNREPIPWTKVVLN